MRFSTQLKWGGPELIKNLNLFPVLTFFLRESLVSGAISYNLSTVSLSNALGRKLVSASSEKFPASPNCWTLWRAVPDARKEILVSGSQAKPSHQTSMARSCLQILVSYVEVLDAKRRTYFSYWVTISMLLHFEIDRNSRWQTVPGLSYPESLWDARSRKWALPTTAINGLSGVG